MSLVQLDEKRNARIVALSGGQKQRLALACALVGDPELLFLDEPTTGLDPQARRQLWDLIEEFKRTGRTIVLTTHYMEEAERLCDRVAIMDTGSVIALATPRRADRVDRRQPLDGDLATGGAHPLDPDTFRKMDGVRDARAENGSLRIQAVDLHRVLPALLEELRRLECPLDGVADALRDPGGRLRIPYGKASPR